MEIYVGENIFWEEVDKQGTLIVNIGEYEFEHEIIVKRLADHDNQIRADERKRVVAEIRKEVLNKSQEITGTSVAVVRLYKLNEILDQVEKE